MGLGRIATDHDKRWQILEQGRLSGGHAERPDPAKLVHHGVTTENSAIVHHHMPGQGGVIGQNAVITNHAVVGDVYVGHQEIVIADGGEPLILHGTTMDGTAFADNVVVTNHQTRGLAGVLFILTRFADAGKLENRVIPANHRRAF